MTKIDQLLDEGKRTEWGYVFDRALTQDEQDLFSSWLRDHIMEFEAIKIGCGKPQT